MWTSRRVRRLLRKVRAVHVVAALLFSYTTFTMLRFRSLTFDEEADDPQLAERVSSLLSDHSDDQRYPMAMVDQQEEQPHEAELDHMPTKAEESLKPPSKPHPAGQGSSRHRSGRGSSSGKSKKASPLNPIPEEVHTDSVQARAEEEDPVEEEGMEADEGEDQRAEDGAQSKGADKGSILEDRRLRAAKKAVVEQERKRLAQALLALEQDPGVMAAAYEARKRERQLASAAKEQQQVPFMPQIVTASPSHGPKHGGTVLLLRGFQFGDRYTDMTVTIGGVPCEETRWLGPEAVACITPAGSGVKLPIDIVPCACSPDTEDTPTPLPDSAVGNPVFSYNEDALRGVIEEAPQMVLRPKNVSRQMHARMVSNGLEGQTFEAMFFNHRLQQMDYYGMVPSLIQSLPARDLPAEYDTCAVVGRGGSLLGAHLGGEIDRHSAVFRFDNCPTSLKFAADVGRRTKFQVINDHWAASLLNLGSYPEDPLLPRVTRWWIDVANVVLWSDASQAAYVKLRHIYPNAAVTFLSREITSLADAFAEQIGSRIEKALHLQPSPRHHPTSQIYALVMALNMCNKVRVYGLDSGCTMRKGRCVYTYFDESEPAKATMQQLMIETNIIQALQEAGTLEVVQTHHRLSQHAVAKASLVPGGGPTCDGPMCTPPCSGNGRYFNGTCHCRKMYSGDSCELDHLDLNADSLLQGIDLSYQEDILLNQKSVNWIPPPNLDVLSASGSDSLELGAIAIPPGIIHNKTGVSDNFMIDRRTYHLLPPDDSYLFDNWMRMQAPRDPKHETRSSLRKPGLGTCALVGNSGTLLLNQYGNAIDGHDVVYRFNQAPTEGFKGEVGSKCTHEGLNSAWVKLLVEGKHGEGVFGQHRSWDWRSDDTALVLFELFDPTAYQQKGRDSILTKEQWWKKAFQRLRSRHPDRKVLVMSPKFVAWAFSLYQNFEDRFENLGVGTFRGEKPMSGYYAIMYALQVCSEVDVYGFTPYQETDAGDPLASKYHYQDEAVPRHNSHSFDLTQNMYRLLARQLPYFRIFD